MRQKKPAGWPDLMTAKRLASGLVSYYWAPPTRAKKAGCPVAAEALGTDYGAAKARCDTVLNPHYHAWRTSSDEPTEPGIAKTGTFDWLVSIYKRSPRYTKLPAETRSSYDRMLALVSDVTLTDGRRLGVIGLKSITPGVADKLYEKVRVNKDGKERTRTAILAMRVCSRAWNTARRSETARVPVENPFGKMGLTYKAKPTRLFQYDDLMKFVAKADERGEPSLGTAAMLAFFWLQRETDIIGRLTWGHIKPADAPNCARIFHHKTGETVDTPLYDVDGSALWPELMERLDKAERRGTLIIMKDKPDRFKKLILPWPDRFSFAKAVAKVRKAADIPDEVKFMGLRHGGNTEGAEANLTDAQIRALSGHLTTAAMLRYVQASKTQRVEGARKRRDFRTKKGNASE
ncbi:MAG: hypothetical protein M9932_02335 [Xanthobacteraceae bacterium]|nr:hypothetical protein [Xanthobacteraceae bacterium]